MSKPLVCDICSKPNPTWSYPTKNFVIDAGPVDLGSFGGWAACDNCHDAIEKNGMAGSVAATIKSMEETGEYHPAMAGLIVQLHDKFFKNRTGPPERIK